MLLSYLYFLFRTALVIMGNLLKKGLRPPDYVIFTLHGSYPDLREPPVGFIQQIMKARLKSLQELEKEFRLVAKNPRVKGIILHLGAVNLTFSQVQSLAGMLRLLRNSGKTVITWATNYDTLSYALAASGDRVLLQEGGAIHTLGFSSRQLYMKNALEWLGVEMDVVQVSPYKSSLERFVRSNMSEEVKEMTAWLLDSYYGQYVSAVASGRGLTEQEVHSLIGQTPLYGDKAKTAGAIDGVVNAEDLPAFLGSSDKPARLAAWDECKKCFPRPLPPQPGKYIALLRVQGNIIDGESRRPPGRPPLPLPFIFAEQTGDLTFVQQARRVLRDKRARAVLLYIESGGGSAAASEAMTAALKKIAGRKPLVALMGSTAASGGYYVATAASHVVAQPAAITGSIGVIAAKIVNSRLLERLLLNRETLYRGQKELFASPEEPFTDEERNNAMDFLNYIYELFITRVAESRSKSPEAVAEIGGGKVWTGEQALEHGLIDELGGLETALARLCEMAKLPPETPLVETLFPRRKTAPLPAAGSWIDYTLESMARVRKQQALLAGPLYFHQPPDRETQYHF